MSAQLCEHCLAFSGVYLKHNRCCRVRMISLMPKTRRLAAYQDAQAREGIEAAQELRALVMTEHERRVSYRASN